MSTSSPPSTPSGSAVHPKVAAATIAAAISSIGCWALNAYAHAAIPNDVQASITVLLVALAGYFMPSGD